MNEGEKERKEIVLINTLLSSKNLFVFYCEKKKNLWSWMIAIYSRKNTKLGVIGPESQLWNVANHISFTG